MNESYPILLKKKIENCKSIEDLKKTLSCLVSYLEFIEFRTDLNEGVGIKERMEEIGYDFEEIPINYVVYTKN